MKRRHLLLVALSLILTVCMCLALTGCKKKKPVTLSVPAVTISDDGIASWEEVTNASGYSYKIDDGEEKSTGETSVNLTDGQSIAVKAVGDGKKYRDSAWSASQTYTKPDDGPITLSTPAVTIDDEGLASWTANPNASGYKYKIDDGEEQTTEDTSVQLTDGQSIAVQAVGDGTEYSDSAWSEKKTFNRIPTLSTPSVSISVTGLATWSPIAFATSYSVKINGGEPNETPVTKWQLSDGDRISVMAISESSGYRNSAWSEEVTYTAPSTPTTQKLATPSVKISEDGKATWDPVPNASAYAYIVNGIQTVTDDSTVPTIQLSDGDKIKVQALGNGTNYTASDWSEELEYTAPAPEKQKLEAPVVTVDKDGNASWKPVPNAISYSVLINGEVEATTNGTTAELTELGDRIRVKAIGDGETYFDSDWSNEAYFTEQLETPDVAVGTDGVVTWDRVTNATGYKYKITDADGTVTETPTSNLSVTIIMGQSVQVQALGDGRRYSDSEWSPTKVVPVPLTTPSVTIDKNGVATWNPVPHAAKYSVLINGTALVEVTLCRQQLSDGDSISVMAISEDDSYTDSEWSDPVTYHYVPDTAPDEDKVNEDLSQLTNPVAIISDDAYTYNLLLKGAHDTTITWSFEGVDRSLYTYDEVDTTGIFVVTRIMEEQTVTATATVSLGDASREKVFTLTVAKHDPITLTPPVVTLGNDNKATWTEVAHATKYIYQIKENGATDWGAEQETTELSVNLQQGQSFHVKAYGDGDNYPTSGWSNTVTVLIVLTKPVVTITDGEASWEEDSRASGYKYKINGGEEQTADGTSVQLEEGQTIEVKAVGDGTAYADSPWSDEKTAPYALGTPAVYIDGNVARWNPVTGASGYEYVVTAMDGTTTNGTKSTSDELKVELNIGDKIQVKAVGDNALYKDSPLSAPESYIPADEMATLDFSTAEQSAWVNNYTSSFDATSGDYTWVVAAFNNGQETSNWEHVRTGHKSSVLKGTITTKTVIIDYITKVVVTVDIKSGADKVNSFRLEVSYNGEFDGADIVETVTLTIKQGANEFALTQFRAGHYYRIVVDCNSGFSNNGDIRINKVEYLGYLDETVHRHHWVSCTHNEGTWTHTSHCDVAGCDYENGNRTEACIPVLNVCPACDNEYTAEEIVEALFELASGDSLPGTYSLTGVVKSIVTAYNSTYKNVSFFFTVDDHEIEAFRAKSGNSETDYASLVNIGFTVTVTGELTRYNDTYEFVAECLITALEDTRTDDDKVKAERDSFKFNDTQYSDEADDIQLPPESGEASLTWRVTNDADNEWVTIEDNVMSILKLPDEDSKEVSLTVIFTINEATAEKEIFITLYPSGKKGTLSNPYTASEALAEAKGLPSGDYTEAPVYVTGYVIDCGSWSGGNYNNFTNVYIADSPSSTKTSADAFKLYRLYPDGEKVKGQADLKLGAKITAVGYLQNYSGNSPQMTYKGDNNPTIVSYEDPTDEAKVALALAALPDIAGEYNANFTVVTTSNGFTVSWEPKVVSGDGNLTISGATATIMRGATSDTVVTVTASITSGDFTGTRDFTVTVLKAPAAGEKEVVSLAELDFTKGWDGITTTGSSGYVSTTPWTATANNVTWSILGFHHNNKGWQLIKAGSGGTSGKATSPYISVTLPGTATKFSFTISSMNASEITSANLVITKPGSEEAETVATIDIKSMLGTAAPVEIEINEDYQGEGYTYSLQLELAKASSNGSSIQITKLSYEGYAKQN